MPHEGTHPATARTRRTLPLGLAALVASGALMLGMSAPVQAHETSAGTDSTSTVHLGYTSGRAADVVNYAASFAGTPYHWGGTTPSTGFDCSGFTDYVFAHFGIRLPRTAGAQAAAVTHVSKPRPGDLVFFTDSPGGVVHHVGIYAGDHYIWHAPHTGAAVRLERIWTDQVFYGRVLPDVSEARVTKHVSKRHRHGQQHQAGHHAKKHGHEARGHAGKPHHPTHGINTLSHRPVLRRP
jgi:cell wall-associated NlpC family hydrolase